LAGMTADCLAGRTTKACRSVATKAKCLVGRK
jgi:hypothetical protein